MRIYFKNGLKKRVPKAEAEKLNSHIKAERKANVLTMGYLTIRHHGVFKKLINLDEIIYIG